MINTFEKPFKKLGKLLIIHCLCKNTVMAFVKLQSSCIFIILTGLFLIKKFISLKGEIRDFEQMAHSPVHGQCWNSLKTST